MGRSKSSLRERVESAASSALRDVGYVAPLDVLMRIGWLPYTIEREWRRKNIALFASIQVSVENRQHFIKTLTEWATENALNPLEATYKSEGRAPQPLKFLDDGDEQPWRLHWFPPNASEKKIATVQKKLEKAPDIVVVDARAFEFECSECKRSSPSDFYLREGDNTLCMECVELDHLIFLPTGDATLSRRAKAKSPLSAVVMRYARNRNRWERQGVLVDEQALIAAEEQCAADADVRAALRPYYEARRQREDDKHTHEFTEAIRRLFPSCPIDEAKEIASHAAVRGSGRVGRSAGGRALDDEAITLAVIASVRHRHTRYDELLMRGVERRDARDRIRDDVENVLRRWR
jgi:hypothetical protein